MVRILVSGILALIIAMGIGRFSYTPILPLMQTEWLLNVTIAGILASMNYAGYFLGAWAASRMRWIGRRTSYVRVSLFLSIATTASMGLVDHFGFWSILRFISGFVSAFVFVLTSSIVLDVLAEKGKTVLSGILYSGVGMGIALTGITVPFLNQLGGWRSAWEGLAVLSLLLVIHCWIGLKETPTENGRTSPVPKDHSSDATSIHRGIRWITLAYGLEGMGYIVSGTFLVAMAKEVPGMPFHGASSWIWVGLAAAPSCMIWSWLAKRWGDIPALCLAYLIQAIGVALPVFMYHPSGIFLGAILFGGTFMGITTITTALGRKVSPKDSSKIIASLTAFYGVGQMIGPLGAGILISLTNGYSLALTGSACIILLGLICLFMAKKEMEEKEHALC